jgi:1-acyl-sn-glycerol-3-phosphate acyltransferase
VTDGPRPGALISLARWLLCALTTAPLLTACALIAPVNRAAGFALYRGWARLQLRIFDVEVETEASPELDERAFVFVQLNQSSLFETFVLPPGAPGSPSLMINAEYALIPGLGLALVASGAVVVVRQWSAQARRAVGRAVRLLEGGQSLFISIEGKRSATGALSRYKKGPIVIAIQAQVDLAPVVIEGCRARLPYGEWRVRPGRVRVRYLSPIPVRGATFEDRHALLERVADVAERELGQRPPQ